MLHLTNAFVMSDMQSSVVYNTGHACDTMIASHLICDSLPVLLTRHEDA